MDSAKAAVKDFMSKSGHHDTTVHEQVAPAVTNETVQRTQHENVTTAIDKEVHQDHYHTSVQPVQDRAVMAEQHHHNVIPVEHKSYEHDDADRVKAKLAAESAQFRDSTTAVEGKHTSSVNPVLGGEHVHHHIHETIQPVVQKQTIEPHVVHTTVPIHEVHHNAGQHHATSALPAVSMADFKKQGGVLTGREERYDGFEGEPRNIGSGLGSNIEGGSTTHGSTSSSGLTGSKEHTKEHTKEHGSRSSELPAGSHGGTDGRIGTSTSRTEGLSSSGSDDRSMGQKIKDAVRGSTSGPTGSNADTTGSGRAL